MSSEEWKIIEGFPMYKISNKGRIFNNRYNRFLKPYFKEGYLRVRLASENASTDLSAHRLVAKAFIPNPENKPEVNHKDGVKNNNDAANLEWVTHEENMRHASILGLFKTEKNNIGAQVSGAHRRKLTEEAVLDIRANYQYAGRCAGQKDMRHSVYFANKYDVTHVTVLNALKNRGTYKEIA